MHFSLYDFMSRLEMLSSESFYHSNNLLPVYNSAKIHVTVLKQWGHLFHSVLLDIINVQTRKETNYAMEI